MKDKEAQDVLKRVIAIIEAEKVPDDLRTAAFDRIWPAVVGETATASPPAPEDEPLSRDEVTDGLALLAAKLNQEREVVEEFFELEDDGSFRVQVPVGDLDESQKGGTEQLALLVCAGRQFGDVEDRTSVEIIRPVCDYYDKLNRPNFAKTVRGLDRFFMISGRGRQLALKLKRTGWEEAGRLVGELASA